jgi:hypothetical protein
MNKGSLFANMPICDIHFEFRYSDVADRNIQPNVIARVKGNRK